MSRIVKGWENPYAAHHQHLQDAAAINYRKVQARKAEKLYTQTLKSGNLIGIEHLDSLKEQVASQDRTIEVNERKPKAAVVRPTVRQPIEMRPMQTIDGPVRCVEVTQGGATLWTAENDGGIAVRSGANGEVVVAIPPREDNTTVDVLFATSTHMWAGLSDGTVVVFDHLVFVQVTEGTFHTKAVTGFAPIADGRMISSSDDGSLTKWDNEAKNFEAITKFVPQQLGSITAVVADASILFCGGSSGRLISVDSDKGEHLMSFDGHSGPITALAVIDAYLFSAGQDATVRIWNMLSGQALKVAATPSFVCSLIPVAETHRIWLAMNSGLLQVWRTSPDDGFACERSVHVHEGRPLLGIKSLAAVESLKVWTLASDGVNKVWCSSYNRAEEGMRNTVEALRAVITQDTIELDKWRTLVLRLQNVDLRRKVQLSLTLEAYHRDLRLRRTLWQWNKFVKLQQEHRKRAVVAERLCLETRTNRVKEVFMKWYTWYRAAQANTVRRKYSEISATVQEANLLAAYSYKLAHVARQEKTQKLRAQLAETLGTMLSRCHQRIVFRRWLRFAQTRKEYNNRVKNATTLLAFNKMLLMRRYLSTWMRVREIIEARNANNEVARKLCRLNHIRHMQGVWAHWAQRHRRAVLRRQQAAFAVTLSTRGGLNLLQVYYQQWLSNVTRKHLGAIQAQNDVVRSQLSLIRQRYSDLSVLFEEKVKNAALRKQEEEKQKELEKCRNRLKALEREKIRMQTLVAEKEMKADREAESISEQLEHIMSQLKSSVINYYTDSNLFHQIRERIRAGQPVTKIFLESHQAVKRVVVEITRNPHLSAFEKWPLSNEILMKIPPHSITVLLGAIKTMIVTFDIMGREDHDNITSDSEIVLNGHWLMVMAKLCIAHKKKTVALRR